MAFFGQKTVKNTEKHRKKFPPSAFDSLGDSVIFFPFLPHQLIFIEKNGKKFFSEKKTEKKISEKKMKNGKRKTLSTYSEN